MIEYLSISSISRLMDLTLGKQNDLYSICTRLKEHLASMRNGHPELSAAAKHVLDTGHRLKRKEPIVAVRNFHTSLSSLYSFDFF